MDFRRKKYYLLDFKSGSIADQYDVKRCLPYGIKIKCKNYKYGNRYYYHMTSVKKEFSECFEFLMKKFKIKFVILTEEGYIEKHNGIKFVVFTDKDLEAIIKKRKDEVENIIKRFNKYKETTDFKDENAEYNKYVKLCRYIGFGKGVNGKMEPNKPLTVWIEEKEFYSLRPYLKETIEQIIKSEYTTEYKYVEYNDYLNNYIKHYEYDNLIL